MYTTLGVFLLNRLIVACSSAVRYREGAAVFAAGGGHARHERLPLRPGRGVHRRERGGGEVPADDRRHERARGERGDAPGRARGARVVGIGRVRLAVARGGAGTGRALATGRRPRDGESPRRERETRADATGQAREAAPAPRAATRGAIFARAGVACIAVDITRARPRARVLVTRRVPVEIPVRSEGRTVPGKRGNRDSVAGPFRISRRSVSPTVRGRRDGYKIADRSASGEKISSTRRRRRGRRARVGFVPTTSDSSLLSSPHPLPLLLSHLYSTPSPPPLTPPPPHRRRRRRLRAELAHPPVEARFLRRRRLGDGSPPLLLGEPPPRRTPRGSLALGVPSVGRDPREDVPRRARALAHDPHPRHWKPPAAKRPRESLGAKRRVAGDPFVDVAPRPDEHRRPVVQDERRRGPEREVRGRDALERVPAEPRVRARDEHRRGDARRRVGARARAARRSSSWPITRPSIGPRTRWYIASANGASALGNARSPRSDAAEAEAEAASAEAASAEAASAAATDSKRVRGVDDARLGDVGGQSGARPRVRRVERRFLRRQNGRELAVHRAGTRRRKASWEREASRTAPSVEERTRQGRARRATAQTGTARRSRGGPRRTRRKRRRPDEGEGCRRKRQTWSAMIGSWFERASVRGKKETALWPLWRFS